MKKKRFLKLVMSYGIQRDKAARMAARVGKFGSYEALFLSLRPSLAFWQMGAAVRWWVKTPNPNYSKPQAEERQG